MSFIPLGFGEFVVTYSQIASIRPAQWTIGVRLTGVPNIPDYVDAVINSWDNAGNVLSGASFDARASIVGVRMTYQTATGPIVVDRPLSTTGSRSGDAQPPNVAALIRRYTDRGGRRGRGRLYLPSAYLNEADVLEGGQIGAARLVELQALANNIWIGAEQNGARAVLLHNDNLVDPDEITSFEAMRLVATMRRRLRK